MKKANTNFDLDKVALINKKTRAITNYSNIAKEKLTKLGYEYSTGYIIYVANDNAKTVIEPILKVFIEMVKENEALKSELDSVINISEVV